MENNVVEIDSQALANTTLKIRTALGERKLRDTGENPHTASARELCWSTLRCAFLFVRLRFGIDSEIARRVRAAQRRVGSSACDQTPAR